MPPWGPTDPLSPGGEGRPQFRRQPAKAVFCWRVVWLFQQARRFHFTEPPLPCSRFFSTRVTRSQCNPLNFCSSATKDIHSPSRPNPFFVLLAAGQLAVVFTAFGSAQERSQEFLSTGRGGGVQNYHVRFTTIKTV